ncbi:MAG: MBL fold metallo-hydrolase [Candidatus Eremiobacteraeota bacterium]|nr:MBL fold metallo-hydrolase [Candidatus Eremiobacteraeota bacterium]
MSRTEAAEVITSYLHAVARKESGVAERFFHPDVEYMVNGVAALEAGGTLPPISPRCSAALPWLGLYRRRDAINGFLEHMHRNLEITEFGPLEVISSGDKGAAFGWFRLQALSTGRTAAISFGVNFEVYDGRIVKYHFVENTFDVADAFRADGSWIVSTDGAEKMIPPLTIHTFTSSEPGAWSNSYLIAGASAAVLFDVVMLRSDAERLADAIERSGKKLETALVSHAHPDHFLALDVIAGRFPKTRLASTADVVADIRADGPWMMRIVQQKFGADAATRLVVPESLSEPALRLEDQKLEIVEFGEGESKHIVCLHVPSLRALFCADLLYNNTHAYLQERHLESWLARLDELESFIESHDISIIYPGHGKPGGAELVEHTRQYLRDFSDAIRLGEAASAQQSMLAKYPEYHAKQFLTAFSIPAYFPGA